MERFQQIWNVYYHVFLDAKSNSLLVDACRELREASQTMERWHSSRFSQFMHMSSSSTLAELRKYLALYLKMATATTPDQQAHRRRIERAMRAMYAQHNEGREHPLLDPGCGGPLAGFLDDTQALYRLYEDYWANGVVSGAASSGAAVAFANPLFAYTTGTQELGQEFALHYGSEPCQGFHLAEGLVAQDTNTTRSFIARRCAVTAMKQFQGWCIAFNQVVTQQPSRITIRFVLGDAAAVCRLLRNDQDVAIPRFIDNWSPLELQLDGPDYLANAPVPAPRRFMAIDTSNLGDHFGMLNMLLLAIPLLQTSPHAIIATETLLKPGQSEHGQPLGTISGLCTDVQTLAVLLGIAPRLLIDGFSAHNSVHEAALAQSGGDNSIKIRERIVWTRTTAVKLEVDPRLLVQLLHDVYLDMTLHEDWMTMTSLLFRPGADALQRRYQIQLYTRESFTHFLKVVKQRIKSPQTWEAAMDAFLGRIQHPKDARGMLALNSYQDLILHLHLLGVYSAIPTFPEFTLVMPSRINKSITVFRDWPSIPPVVCVTLLVPRSALKPIENAPVNSIANPVIAGNITCGDKTTNDFYSVHAVHGHFARSGHSGGYDSRVRIVPADGSWSKKTSDIVLSFSVPSWILMLEPIGTTVRLVLRAPPTPAMSRWITRLGPDFTIFQANLRDSIRVAVTREAPYTQPSGSPEVIDNVSTRTQPSKTMTVYGAASNKTIKTLGVRVDIPEGQKETWQKKLPVAVLQVTSCTLRISSDAISLDIDFPCPVRGSMVHIKNARASMYCQVSRSLFLLCHGHWLTPMLQIDAPVGRSGTAPCFGEASRGVLHRINLDVCPVIDLLNPHTQLWLTQHIAHMFSGHDADFVKDNLTADAAQPAPCADVLVALKDVVRVIFVESARILSTKIGSRSKAIVMGEDGQDSYIVPQALRLDLGAHAVVLDALSISPTLDAQTVPTVARTIRLDSSVTTIWRDFMLACSARLCGSRDRGLVATTSRVAIPLLFPAPFLEPVANIPNWLERAIDYTTPFPKAQSREACKEKTPSVEPAKRVCAHCQKLPEPVSVLLQCSGCKAVSYCDRNCQKAHWKAHKVQCRA